MKALLGLLAVLFFSLLTGCQVYVPPVNSVGVAVGPHGRVGVGVTSGSPGGYYYNSSPAYGSPAPAYVIIGGRYYHYPHHNYGYGGRYGGYSHGYRHH